MKLSTVMFLLWAVVLGLWIALILQSGRTRVPSDELSIEEEIVIEYKVELAQLRGMVMRSTVFCERQTKAIEQIARTLTALKDE